MPLSAEIAEHATTETPILARRRLAYGLAEMRDRSGLSQAAVARKCGCSPGLIGMIESRESRANQRVPSDELIEKLVTLYRREDELDDYLRLCRAARARDPQWTGLDLSADPIGFRDYVGLEAGASSIDAYESRLIPGLLQTDEYARRVIESGNRSRAGLDRLVQIRLDRQHILTRQPEPVQLWVVIEEQVFHRPIGGAATMCAQIEHLLDLGARDNIQLQVMPTAVGAHPGMTTPFTIMEFPNTRDPGLVAVETRIRTEFYERTAEVAQYQMLMKHLRDLALSTSASRDWIEQRKAEWNAV